MEGSQHSLLEDEKSRGKEWRCPSQQPALTARHLGRFSPADPPAKNRCASKPRQKPAKELPSLLTESWGIINAVVKNKFGVVCFTGTSNGYTCGLGAQCWPWNLVLQMKWELWFALVSSFPILATGDTRIDRAAQEDWLKCWVTMWGQLSWATAQSCSRYGVSYKLYKSQDLGVWVPLDDLQTIYRIQLA